MSASERFSCCPQRSLILAITACFVVTLTAMCLPEPALAQVPTTLEDFVLPGSQPIVPKFG